ncbi:hypothetical protein CV019_00625, partial [Staphylococcus haemolyticus]
DHGRLWEVGFAVSDGTARQVSFVNNIATIKGGKHVDHVEQQIVNRIMEHVQKAKKVLLLRPTRTVSRFGSLSIVRLSTPHLIVRRRRRLLSSRQPLALSGLCQKILRAKCSNQVSSTMCSLLPSFTRTDSFKPLMDASDLEYQSRSWKTPTGRVPSAA